MKQGNHAPHAEKGTEGEEGIKEDGEEEGEEEEIKRGEKGMSLRREITAGQERLSQNSFVKGSFFIINHFQRRPSLNL